MGDIDRQANGYSNPTITSRHITSTWLISLVLHCMHDGSGYESRSKDEHHTIDRNFLYLYPMKIAGRGMYWACVSMSWIGCIGPAKWFFFSSPFLFSYLAPFSCVLVSNDTRDVENRATVSWKIGWVIIKASVFFFRVYCACLFISLPAIWVYVDNT